MHLQKAFFALVLMLALAACTSGTPNGLPSPTTASTHIVTLQPATQPPPGPTQSITEETARDPAVSPNGQWKAEIHLESARLEIVSLQGGSSIVYSVPGGEGNGVILGSWAPDSRHLTFWQGPQGQSIQADGLPLWVIDVQTNEAVQISAAVLVNPAYQSWSPDGHALAFTNGGYRSITFGKELSLFQVDRGQVDNQALPRDLVPGDVAWSPSGDWLAVSAVEAKNTSQAYADLMGWDNPAIAARSIYLINPSTGEYHPLYPSTEYQDAPRWSADGQRLFYVQKEGSQASLISVNLATGSQELLQGCESALPETTYYGQVDWSALYNNCPATH